MFVCSNCKSEFPKWSGKCSTCGEWNTLEERQKPVVKKSKIQSGYARETEKILPNADTEISRYTSSSVELDAVLGG